MSAARSSSTDRTCIPRRALGFETDYRNLLELFSGRGRLIRAFYRTAIGEDRDDYLPLRPLVDRLVHHCHIVNIRGNSYRMRDHQNLLQSGSDRHRKKAA